MTSGNLSWYALQVHARLASSAATSLRSKGYEEFLPLYKSRRRWSDRIKYIDLPLFPGYLFCQCNPQERLLPILTTPGVKNVISAGRTPVPVPEEEIASVKRIVKSGLYVEPWPYLPVGSKVRIERGPLAGLDGLIVDADKGNRLVVSVSLLQRSVAVEIDRDWAVRSGSDLQPGAAPLLRRAMGAFTSGASV